MNDLDQLRALAERFGVPGVDLEEVVILGDDLALIPREVCETHRILPVLVRGEHLFLAMVNPGDTRVIDEIEFVTGKKVYPYAALPQHLATALGAAHDARARRATYYVGPGVSEARIHELGVDARGMPGLVEARRPAPPVSEAPTAPLVTPAIPRPVDPRRDPDEASEERVEEVSVVGPLPRPDLRGSAGRGSGTTSKVILVVDDEEDIRVMLKRVLAAKSHRVLEAESGSIALSMVKRHMPDLIILDAMLPGLHGFDVARRLKASERYGSIPIIMISAVYRGWRIVEDLKASYGISDYLEKPFHLEAVLAAATRALATKAPTTATPQDLDVLNASATKALEDGIAAYRAGNVDLAIETLRRGTELDPLAFRLHFHLALLYGKKERVFDAISELEVAVELHPKHFPALKNLALLYERAGFKNRAVEIWERCVHTAPDAMSKAQVKERLVALL